jgi:hypothetical protein
MIRSNAQRRVALMQYTKIATDGAVSNLPRDPMSISGVASIVSRYIAITLCSRSRPEPATIRFLHLYPKPFSQWQGFMKLIAGAATVLAGPILGSANRNKIYFTLRTNHNGNHISTATRV